MDKQHDYSGITTVEAAFAAKGIDLQWLMAMFESVPREFREHTVTSFSRTVVVAAINGPWKPNWQDIKEQKWYPWWRITTKPGFGGVGLSLDGCGCADTIAVVGARHVFNTRAQAEHYATHFVELDAAFYGGESFDFRNITTVADALAEQGLSEAAVEEMHDNLPASYRQQRINSFMLDVVEDVINSSEPVDWNNTQQKKWRHWWNIHPGSRGVGLSLCGCYFVNAHAAAGAHRAFSSRERAEHAAEHFKALYEQEFNNK